MTKRMFLVLILLGLMLLSSFNCKIGEAKKDSNITKHSSEEFTPIREASNQKRPFSSITGDAEDPQEVNLTIGWVRINGTFLDSEEVLKYRFYVPKGLQFKVSEITYPRQKIIIVESSSNAIIYENWYLQGGAFFSWHLRTKAFFFVNDGYYELHLIQHNPSLDYYEILLGLQDTAIESFPLQANSSLQGIDDHDIWRMNLSEGDEMTFDIRNMNSSTSAYIDLWFYSNVTTSASGMSSSGSGFTFRNRIYTSGEYYLKVSTDEIITESVQYLLKVEKKAGSGNKDNSTGSPIEIWLILMSLGIIGLFRLKRIKTQSSKPLH